MADINPMSNSQTAAVQSVSPYATTLKAQEIRVVLLAPGQWDDEISCHLVNSSLESPLEYEALSYVWAQEPGHRYIRLNDSMHQITTNLFLALRRLRKASEARCIWIDALCINQENDKEKNHQVALMGSIYELCTRALLWLGDYESPAGSPRQTLTIEQAETQSWEEISKEQSGMQDKGFAAMTTIHELSVNKHPLATSMFEEGVKSDERNDPHHLRSFSSLFGLPWWTRIWTFQEAILPPMAIVLYGSFAVKWEVLEMANNCFFQHVTTCCYGFFNMAGKGNFSFEFNDTMSRFRDRVGSLVLWRTRRKSNTDKIQLLHRMLWDHRSRQASEPRDLFYGLLGLTGGMVPDLMVDYSLPCEAVFKIATLLSIQQTGKLYILQRSKNSHVRKPSWIYDFDTVFSSDVWGLERASMFREAIFFTAAGTSKSVAFWNDFQQDHLELKGIFCSEVVLVGDSLSSDGYTSRGLSSILIKWESLAKGFYSNPKTDTPYGRDWMSEYLRTIVSDFVPDREAQFGARRVCAADLPIIRGVVDKAIRMEQPPSAIFDRLLYDGIISSLTNRTFFITADGYVGLGSPELGDEIWVLSGGDTPFILRPSVSDSGCHQLIGSCYVQGLMDGEAMVNVEAKQRTVSLC